MLQNIFLTYNYFPKDSFFRELARSFIAYLLREADAASKKAQEPQMVATRKPSREKEARLKKYALQYTEKFIEEGILSEKEDYDIIEQVTH